MAKTPHKANPNHHILPLQDSLIQGFLSCLLSKQTSESQQTLANSSAGSFVRI